MAFREMRAKWLRQYPKGVTERYVNLDIYDKMLDGSFYDVLTKSFEQEEDSGKVIPLRERRPLIQYSLPVLIRDRQAAQIFGTKARPRVRAYPPKVLMDPLKNVDQDATSYIEALIKTFHLYDIMSEALESGQSGSCAITVTALDDNSPYINVVAGKEAFPIFAPRNPNKLVMLRRQYPISGKALNNTGIYPPEKFNAELVYWMRIDLDETREQWFYPMEDERFQKLGKLENGVIVAWQPDDEHSYDHKFGVVPAVWIRNLNIQRGIDGRCTFQSIVDLQITLDYLASGITRGFIYTSDPLIAINRGEMDELMPAGGMSILDEADEQAIQTQEVNKNPAKVLTIPSGGKAQLLEITGNGLAAAKEWFKTLRDMALEILSGSKAGQEKTGEGNPHSGRALEVLNSLEAWLLERQAAAYGDNGLVSLIRVLLCGIRAGILDSPVAGVVTPDDDTIIELMWPRRALLLGGDLLNQMMALQTAAGGSAMNPVQLVPRDVITSDAMSALGHPDPATNSEQVLKEWTETLDIKAKAEADSKPTPKLTSK